MGKASSSKKVRAVARSGGRRGSAARSGPNLAWPVSVGAIVVLGVLLIVASRGGGDDTSIPPRILEDHWHVAYGVWACDRWLPPLQDQSDPSGIHSHGDGVIHVHPFSASAAGENARLDRFTDALDGFDLSDTRLRVPGVGSFEVGDTDCDGEPATLRVLVWDDARNDEEPSRIVTESLADVPLTDGSAIAIVFAPEDEEIPKPPTVPQLDNLTDVPGGQQGGASTTAPAGTTEGTDDTTGATDTETTEGDTDTTATSEAP